MVSGLFGMIGLPGIEDGVKAVFRGKKAIPPELPKGSSKRAQKRSRVEVKEIEGLIMRHRSGRSLYTMA